ncbi:MAG TPA: hypothetical protein VMY18_05840 [Acidobacteriota bacterium]|nr:hypothetical protein [Acidobacteriota bacterium]
MKLNDATSMTVSGLWADLEGKIREAGSLEEASQELAASLHRNFEESAVLARVFATVPYEALPSSNRKFVDNLADSADARSGLKPSTPVLSLVGTYGPESNWQDRQKSQGHVGIPLISSAFVDAIPMISRLIKELGLALEWVDSNDTEKIVETIGTKAGLFYVEDAASATDSDGRKIIAAQDFVSDHNVGSVFGTAGAYPSGQLAVAVVFCRERVSRSVAELFLPLTDLFKAGTVNLMETGKVFA